MQIPSEAVLRSFLAAAAESEVFVGTEGSFWVWRVLPALALQHGLPDQLPSSLVSPFCRANFRGSHHSTITLLETPYA